MWFHHDHEKLERIAHELRELFEAVLGEQIMSQAQFTLTLTINPVTPPPNPVVLGSPSGSDTETQGAQFTTILTPVTGGVPPYTASVDAASPNPLPPGVSAGIDASNNLIITGAAAGPGTGTVLLDVVDSLGNSPAARTIRRP
jgi:hypothetical protein